MTYHINTETQVSVDSGVYIQVKEKKENNWVHAQDIKRLFKWKLYEQNIKCGWVQKTLKGTT